MDEKLKNISVVLPSLDPGDKFIKVVNDMISTGFSDIIIIDDGSREENQHYFEEAALNPEVTVIHHDINRGKGTALKTAFAYYLENRPEGLGVVTVDGDGQHLGSDSMKCALRMAESGNVIIGARDFSSPRVPKRNRFGNRLTSLVFGVIGGMKISDTQTGLRAFPRSSLPVFIETAGERFEYETRMLLDMKDKHIPYEEVRITTVYDDDSNRGSHFNVVRDSAKIYWVIFSHIIMYSMSSLVSWMFEQGIDVVLPMVTPGISVHIEGSLAALFANSIQFIPGAILSSILNLMLNRKVVFRDQIANNSYVVRYYVLWAAQLAVRFGLLYIIRIALENSSLGGYSTVWLIQVFSILIQGVLFVAGYRIQRDWVFKSNKSRKSV